jgi:hypothetical protein
MTQQEFLEELDTIIDAATGFTEGDTDEYVRELAEHDEALADAIATAFAALEQAAERSIELKEDEA